MKSDLYDYELRDNMVELSLVHRHGKNPNYQHLFNITQDEILEIADTIKQEKYKGCYGCCEGCNGMESSCKVRKNCEKIKVERRNESKITCTSNG